MLPAAARPGELGPLKVALCPAHPVQDTLEPHLPHPGGDQSCGE